MYFRAECGWTSSVDLRPFDAEGEIKGKGTYVVAPGSVVRFDRDGEPLEPVAYEWTVAPDVIYGKTQIPVVSLLESGLVPAGFGKWHTGDTGDTGHSGDSGDSRKGAAVRLDLIEIVDRHSINGPGQRRNALKAFAFDVLGLHADKPNEAIRNKFFTEWWQRYGEHCRTDEETSWLEFDQMIDELRGADFKAQLARAIENVEVPPWADRLRSRAVGREVARVIVAADAIVGGGWFYLSIRDMALLANNAAVNTAYRAVQKLHRAEIIEVIPGEARPGGKATHYRLLIDPDGRAREMESVKFCR